LKTAFEKKDVYSFIPNASLLLYDVFDLPHWNNYKSELPVAPDTYRKMLNGVDVSQGSKNKILDFYSCETNLDPANVFKYWKQGGYLHQSQLKGFIDGMRLTYSEPKKSFFLDQLEKLLDIDIQISHLCNEEKNEKTRHQIFWQSNLAKLLFMPLDLKKAPSKEHHEQFIAYGKFSLIMYFIAAYEVALRNKYSIDFHDNKSLVNTQLPKFVDSGIDWPIKNVTRFWQNTFNISSVEKLAASIPISEDVDIEHKKRRLEFWRSGERNPNIDPKSTLVWVEAFCRDSSAVYKESVRFNVATILQRFAKQMYPDLFPPKVNSNIIEFESISKKQKMQQVEKLFQIYKHHYQSNMNDFRQCN